MKHYILQGKEAVPADLMTWASWYETADRHVAKSGGKDKVLVSTVFLGLDHAFGGGAPVLYETMIFGGEHDQHQQRYHTWDEAEAGHRKACEMAGIEP